ncbi:PRC-barrel domain-containing protein [Undibacterium sp. RTI2.1]|uniref:PRC-barrel domain-containing protein n=1 Tax=unclassified Undibacterium TaxID=2630295 RepID=UPI002AB54CAF|nr:MULTISPECIES: PRC-barrel domain-containing protein [unclassified Undibacterium]MDY7537415.1 PRC-barrel domain-containing protein [Undibacterium sp. 5I1]MEB0031200.1 PRC-barrel domain-containing protein [Undibacterium sp. RTI2.1]MEB0117579.1 PRC-barrel domain-containing protein [Undibacterium sp. RTI2.2]MEB0232285.1 PRC-barrel domain-containing protein [Undibacterium sp. 10I3]MEB0259799.1 PRC-barrel domain-containing protein [Undibacterium sp. 5I1]
MKLTKNRILIAVASTLAISGALMFTDTGVASAQVAGSTTMIGMTVSEVQQVATGWSAKKSILGKSVYNETGEKIGKVEDLIITPEKNVSYLIIAVGGFIGLGQHNVSIPSPQIIEQDGKLILPGASKEAVKAMPPFNYASDTAKRDLFLANAEQDLNKAKAKIAEIQKKSATLSGEAKTKLDQQLQTLQQDVKLAEDKLTAMKRAEAKKWKNFEADVNKAFVRMKHSMESIIT